MQDTELSFAIWQAFESLGNPHAQGPLGSHLPSKRSSNTGAQGEKRFGESTPKLPPLTPPYLTRVTRSVFDALDMQQLAITRRLSPAERLRQVFEINRALSRLIATSIRNQQPNIDDAELRRRVAQRISGIYEL